MRSRSPWLLDPTVTFLNHGSFGGAPAPVLEAQSHLREELERRPIAWLAPERELIPKLDAVRERLGALIGADPQDLVFVQNATTAVNAVLRSARFVAGDEIVFTSHGYNACNNVVRYLGEVAGVVPVVADVPFPIDSPGQVVEAIERVLTPRTKLVLVDHVTSPTGLVLPIEAILALCHARGVRVLVDGAHAPGMLPLALDTLGADYYTGNCHKWLCAPKGCAFLHVRRALQHEVRPVTISHGYNTPQPGRSRYLTEFDWPGTYDPTPILALPTAIDWLDRQATDGIAGVMRQNRDLALAARALLCAELGLTPPAPEEMLGALVTLPLPPGPAPEGPLDPLHVKLYEAHRIEVPVVHCPRAGVRWFRVSAQLHNDLDDYRELARALRAEGVGRARA
ncbi:MAG: aminotransferase class V-fold PLP-dependent enzyme [Planctomycetota bacterium]